MARAAAETSPLRGIVIADITGSFLAATLLRVDGRRNNAHTGLPRVVAKLLLLSSECLWGFLKTEEGWDPQESILLALGLVDRRSGGGWSAGQILCDEIDLSTPP